MSDISRDLMRDVELTTSQRTRRELSIFCCDHLGGCLGEGSCGRPRRRCVDGVQPGRRPGQHRRLRTGRRGPAPAADAQNRCALLVKVADGKVADGMALKFQLLALAHMAWGMVDD